MPRPPCERSSDGALHEQVEDLRQQLRRDADAVVPDLDDGTRSLVHVEHDLPAGIRVLRGVGEHVRDAPDEPRAVAID